MHSHTTTTSNRSRRRIRLAKVAGLTAALAACALPASASAAQLSFHDGELRYDGLSESNTLSLRHVAGAMIVSDPSGVSNRGLPSAPPGERPCAQVDRQTMRCPVPRRVFADMDEGDDTVGPINTHLPVIIHGGPGDDTYEAGSPSSFLTNVEFVGGADVDTASYAGSGGSGGGRGVRIVNDGQPNDGRLGLDTDNIGRDVERLTGSPFADEITVDVDGGSCCARTVTGGQGDDVLRAGSSGSGGTVIFAMGSAPDGADKIIGGRTQSSVRYSSRTRPVNVTLNFGGADDGEAGERDEIIGGNEQVIGGRAGDTLRAPAGSTASHNILGSGGDDQIDGSDGADTLSGDGGGDTIRAFGGEDRIFAKDGEVDTVECGSDFDRVVDRDANDDLDDCESLTVGVLRLAPKALRAKAGDTARLKLSWRHPDSWRQLRRVTLRLFSGDARVGAVAISPRTRRIADRGAVTVLRRSTRLAGKGKTVSARLRLRLDRQLAGRRLRLEVEAVDVRGARQLGRRAGSIRVSR
jgi:hypothetical protein